MSQIKRFIPTNKLTDKNKTCFFYLEGSCKDTNCGFNHPVWRKVETPKVCESPSIESQNFKAKDPINWASDSESDDMDNEVDNINQRFSNTSITPSIETPLKEMVNRILETPMPDISLSGEPFNTANINGIKYQLYHFPLDICDNHTDDDIKKLRGLIVANGKLVCKAFPFTPEFNTESMDFETFAVPNFANATIVKSYESSQLRLWHYDGIWHLSTYRRIDSFNATWGSGKSFGEQFSDCIKIQLGIDFRTFCNRLDKEKTYCFLLTTDMETRKVCKMIQQQVFCIGSFDRCLDWQYEMCPLETGLCLPETLNVDNIADLKEKIDSMDYDKYQGALMILPQGKLIKIVSSKYNSLSKVRNSNPNLQKRYLELRDKKPVQEPNAQFKEFLDLYADQAQMFKRVEIGYKEFAKAAYKNYNTIFYYRQRKEVSKSMYKFCCEFDDYYYKQKFTNYTIGMIKDYMDSLESTDLLRFIKEFIPKKNEQTQ